MMLIRVNKLHYFTQKKIFSTLPIVMPDASSKRRCGQCSILPIDLDKFKKLVD